jgi:hypothetical protein
MHRLAVVAMLWPAVALARPEGIVAADRNGCHSGDVTPEVDVTFAPGNPQLGATVTMTINIATLPANDDDDDSGDAGVWLRRSFAFGCPGTTYYRDFDGDGVGATSSGTTVPCVVPESYAELDGDCDDNDERRYPDAPELCNGDDDDRDGIVDDESSCPDGEVCSNGVWVSNRGNPHGHRERRLRGGRCGRLGARARHAGNRKSRRALAVVEALSSATSLPRACAIAAMISAT